MRGAAGTDLYGTADCCDEQEFGVVPSTHARQFTLKIERRESVCTRRITSDKRIYRQLSVGVVIVPQSRCVVPKQRTQKYDTTAPHTHPEE
jgi:hypothetical protein